MAVSSLGCGTRDGGVSSNVDAALAKPSIGVEGSAMTVATSARTISTSAIATDPLKFAERNGAFVASNAVQRFATTIDKSGASLVSNAGAWTFSMHVARVGRDHAMRDVSSAAPVARDARIELAHGDVAEWYRHDARGLEQGVDIAARPTGAGDLVVEVGVDGLTAATTTGDGVELRAVTGQPVLRYSQLAATDANGQALQTSLHVVHGTIEIEVDDSRAAYPIEIDPLVWSEQTELTPGDAARGFGSAVSLSGGSALVGAYSSNTAYVFTSSGTTWTQQAELSDPHTAIGDLFGYSVALQGGTALVGAPGDATPGAAYVFAQSGSPWTASATLTPLGAAANSGFGWSVALDGDTAIVGAPYDGTSGAAYVFVQSGSTWTQQARLSVVTAGQLGLSVALSAGTAVVGADEDSSNFAGAAYVFTLTGGAWAQTAMLQASDTVIDDGFGNSVALSGGSLIVGAPNHGTPSPGAAFVFTSSGTAWTQQAKITSVDDAPNDDFGTAVAISGSSAIVGAQGRLSGVGAAYLFSRTGAIWSQQAEFLPTPSTVAHFGFSVALSGQTALVGSYSEGGTMTGETGRVRLYSLADNSNGATCTLAVQCGSGFCVDGYCCDSACTGQCQACNVAGLIGVCSPVTGMPVSPRKVCISDGTLCGGACDGTATTACTYPGATATCRAPTCTGGILTEPTGCNGLGQCPTATPANCGPYACEGTTCKSSCMSDTDCNSAYLCSSGVCIPRVGMPCTGWPYLCTPGTYCVDAVCCNSASCPVGWTCAGSGPSFPFPEGLSGNCFAMKGTACVTGSQCVTGNCVDGVCCSTTCGAGSTCAGGGTLNGTCLEITGNSCTNDSQCVSGNCVDGVCCSVSTCAPCGSCSGPIAGTCGPLAKDTVPTTWCNGYLCGGTSTGCATTCAGDVDCVAGDYCNAGSCTTRLVLGSTCTIDNACASGSCTDSICCTVPSCGAGGYCVGSEGLCVYGTGAPCGSGSHCITGFCTDGFCCTSGSCGAGSACDVPGSLGNCKPVSDAGAGDASTVDGSADSTPLDSGAEVLPDGPSIDAIADTTSPEAAADSATDSATDDVGDAQHATGAACTTNTQCASTFCTDGVCCGAATCGPCGTCKGATPGACTPLAYRTPAPACAPLVCDGVGVGCPIKCVITGDCATGFVCDTTTGSCVAPADAGADVGTLNDASDTSTTSASGGCGLGRNRGSQSGHAVAFIVAALGATVSRRRRRAVVRG
ncbi:MAG: hypothetical protein ACHREM_06675 [Polyangiales bacterium]